MFVRTSFYFMRMYNTHIALDMSLLSSYVSSCAHIACPVFRLPFPTQITWQQFANALQRQFIRATRQVNESSNVCMYISLSRLSFWNFFLLKQPLPLLR